MTGDDLRGAGYFSAQPLMRACLTSETRKHFPLDGVIRDPFNHVQPESYNATRSLLQGTNMIAACCACFPSPQAPCRKADTLLFDLDGTLYPVSNGYHPHVVRRVSLLVKWTRLGIAPFPCDLPHSSLCCSLTAVCHGFMLLVRGI